ncbi:MAG: PKD domain-containing protein, partial [Bacteroidota bacterium]
MRTPFCEMKKLLLWILLGFLPGSLLAQSADFTADRTSGCAGLLSVNFTDASTGSISSHLWSFGDGGTSNLTSPSHTYTAAGTYTVSLTVSGPGGSDTETRSNFITVFAIPQASFTLSADTVCEGTSVLLTSTSVAGSAAISQCLWTFNDGSPADTACPSISHTYINGSNSIRAFYPNLLVVDVNGCNSVDNDTLFVLPRPIASFSFSVNNPCTAPATVTFTNTTSINRASLWDFGISGSTTDTSTTTSPLFTYTTPGTYQVTLTSGGGSCSSSFSQTIQLTSPQADFLASDTVICRYDSIQFFSTGTSGSYAW